VYKLTDVSQKVQEKQKLKSLLASHEKSIEGEIEEFSVTC
jgi:hypothetical protein